MIKKDIKLWIISIKVVNSIEMFPFPWGGWYSWVLSLAWAFLVIESTFFHCPIILSKWIHLKRPSFLLDSGFKGVILGCVCVCFYITNAGRKKSHHLSIKLHLVKKKKMNRAYVKFFLKLLTFKLYVRLRQATEMCVAYFSQISVSQNKTNDRLTIIY